MNFDFLSKKIAILILILTCASCATTQKSTCKCPVQNYAQDYSSAPPSSNPQTQPTKNLSPSQKLELASQLFANGEAEESLLILNQIPENIRNIEYQKLRTNVVNKIVMNMRYKVRILYEKSLLQEGKIKRDLLSQCKKILESIQKNYPEYDDMYAVNNNLKQIEYELAKKS